MRVLKFTLLCFTILIPAMAQICPSAVDVSVCGAPAKVSFEGDYWFDQNIVINDKGERISDKFKWVQGEDHGWKPEPRRRLAPDGHTPVFDPKPLFDDDPETVFSFPLQNDYYDHCMDEFLVVKFEEQQTMDGIIIRPGWQKDIETFNRFELPTVISIELRGDESTQDVFVTLPMDGKVTHSPMRYRGRKIRDFPILRPAATSKNMSERLIMFDRPRNVKTLLLCFGTLQDPAHVMRRFGHEGKPHIRAYISDLLPVLVGHSTGNKLRDGLIDALRKIRDRRYYDLKIHQTLPDITTTASQNRLSGNTGDPVHESFFGPFRSGFFSNSENPCSIRLKKENSLLWAYGGRCGNSNNVQFPVVITNESGEIISAWWRDCFDGNNLP